LATFLSKEVRIEIGKRERHHRRTNIDYENADSIFIQMKKTWTTASQRMAVGVFHLSDQSFACRLARRP